MVTRIGIFLILAALHVLIGGCEIYPGKYIHENPVETITLVGITQINKPTIQVLLSVTRKITTIAKTATPTMSPIPTLSETIEPDGCRKPDDDYAIVQFKGWVFNQRTLDMLKYAAELHHGEIDILSAITQASFHDNGSASFGTHLGGGAVDLSVMRPGTYTILTAEIPDLVRVLRTAGFAAWYRDLNEIEPGSPAHIHAIAIGDRQLSPAAVEQLTGKSGYFRGFSGLPSGDHPPTIDRFGGPLICAWMEAEGYHDLLQNKSSIIEYNIGH